MKRLLVCLALAAASGSAQYKLENAGAPPADLAPAVRDALQKDGARVAGPNGAVCEVWFRAAAPEGSNSEQNVSFKDLPHGALLGIVRFPGKAADRRGQALKPGVYTMRLSFFPVDGAHQGIAPTRDFVLLTPAADDTDVSALPNYSQLVAMSKKAAGTAHPAILGIWKPDAPEKGLKQEGEDWVLYGEVGGRPVAMIVVGTYQG